AVGAHALQSHFVETFDEKALVAVPMLSRDRLEGIVVLDDTRAPRAFSEAWLARAGAMVAQLGLSIANARLYESLRTSYAELAQTRAVMVKRERLAALGELAAIVAHEVRNPLGVIYNAESSLRRVVGTSKDGAVLLDIIHEECRRLNQIVGDLIDFARPRELSMQPEPLPRVVQEAVDIATSQPDAPATRVVQTVQASLPLVPMDRRLIRQAIANIAINAIQAMPHGGSLRVAVRYDAADSSTTVEITDEGGGIADDVLPRIFEPFFTTKAKGAGLGLAVVKRIIEDHGGRIVVSSRAGSGTTFAIRLPVPEEPVLLGAAG
ncbi:MAG TPA: ATP-binding protein, partial [Polyangiaceae bacterium]